MYPERIPRKGYPRGEPPRHPPSCKRGAAVLLSPGVPGPIMSSMETWSVTEKAGAVVLFLLALGLGFIAADIMFSGSSGSLFKRNCCPEEEVPAGDS